MKKEYLTVTEFSLLTGKSKNSIWSQKSRDFRNQENLEKYKVDENGKIIYSSKQYYENISVQEKFENLYYSLIDNFKSEYALAKELAKFSNTSTKNIAVYLRGTFFLNRYEQPRKKDYILAMELLIETL